jgi:formylglycine-generating enzyme required for sulfatase activity
MAKVFISYSRKNIEFVKKLAAAMQEHGLDFWVDWDGIPPTVDWMNEIQKGIEEADTFLFVISPDSITSTVCKQELALAVKNGKRLVPVVAYDIQWNDVPPDLARLNYIFFRESDPYDGALTKLFTAIDTDYDWARVHRRLQVKALEWERSNMDAGFLLRGRDLEEAEQQISVNATKDPYPTEVQRAYLLKSRQATDRQRRISIGVMAFITVVMVGITGVLVTPRVLDRIAQFRARGEMILIPEGPSFFGTENPIYVSEYGFPPRQEIPSLPAFQIGKYEVSNRQYKLCVNYGGCTVPVDQTEFNDDSKQEYPVVNVTLFQSNTYCQWLGQRLPTQYEWERAARGPDGNRWPWGDADPSSDFVNMSWGDYYPTGLQPVNSNPTGVSPEGIYNMIGNVWEWTSTLVVDEMDYDPTRFWDGNPDTYLGTVFYAQEGGGWSIRVDEVALFNPDMGVSARDDLGIRCVADVK